MAVGEERIKMTLESIKEFLKPNRRKVFGVFLFFFLFAGSLIISPTPQAFDVFYSLFFIIFAPPLFLHGLGNILFHQYSIRLSTLLTPVGEIMFLVVSFFLYWYLLSCLIMFVYDKLKSRKKQKREKQKERDIQ